MDRDPRILNIITAAHAGRPADIEEPFAEIVGERAAELVAQARVDVAASFFGDEDLEVEGETDSTAETQEPGEVDDNGEDA